MWESEKFDGNMIESVAGACCMHFVTLHVVMDWYSIGNLNVAPLGEFKSVLNNVSLWIDCAWTYRVGIDDLLYRDVDDRLAESNHVWVFINIKLLLRFRDITCCLKKYPRRATISAVSRDEPFSAKYRQYDIVVKNAELSLLCPWPVELGLIITNLFPENALQFCAIFQ